jgi:hypothetical protein
MMKCIVRFYEKAMQTIKDSEKSEKKISMGYIEQTLKTTVMYQLGQMKFELPLTPEAQGKKYFDDFANLIDDSFRQMTI